MLKKMVVRELFLLIQLSSKAQVSKRLFVIKMTAA